MNLGPLQHPYNPMRHRYDEIFCFQYDERSKVDGRGGRDIRYARHQDRVLCSNNKKSKVPFLNKRLTDLATLGFLECMINLIREWKERKKEGERERKKERKKKEREFSIDKNKNEINSD